MTIYKWILLLLENIYYDKKDNNIAFLTHQNKIILKDEQDKYLSLF